MLGQHLLQDVNGEPERAPTSFSSRNFSKMGFTALAHGGVLPVHHDVETGKSYWLPRDCKPTDGIQIDGKPYGWTPELVKV